MEITWLGRACFLIKGKEKTIVTDPCHPDFGYCSGSLCADIVTVSHLHPGHSYVEGVASNPRKIRGPGEYEVGKTFITGIGTFHDDERGRIRGKNTVYIIETDGVTLCHLGDLGHPLSSQLVEELGSADVLFIPVGEVSTISVDVAMEIVKQLSPHIVIPMHYDRRASGNNLQPVDKFLKRMGIRDVEAKPKLSFTRPSLPSSMETVVLEYGKL